jgi:serine/threonine protein kinase/tetratricopeptide (TPR) repeat protein
MATDAAREICESCGATLHGEWPGGLCPACLLTTAIEEGEAEEPVCGSRIQDYELLNEVARGGMGIVYRARQRVPSRIVALKMILPAHVGSTDAMTRFRAETEAAASLEHEGILPIYAVGEHDGAPFYSMKFAEGGTLADRLGQYRAKPRDAAALVALLARAVAYAHEHGILHRDLKPGNVLFDDASKPYVSDFGLAKWLARESNLTETFGVLGTPFYMAPEQAVSSHMVTASADIYSLGAILYHLLTGHPPFTGDTPMEVLHRAAEQPAPRPRLTNRSIPPDLETICLKCLEKDPAWRYSSAAALVEDLDRFCTGHAIQARRTGLVTRGGKWIRRNPSIALMAALLLALGLPLGMMIWKREPEQLRVSNLAVPEKSIAVLPFANLSNDPANVFFTDGIQAEILSGLAKVADLRVISRTSVMQYKDAPRRNLREIGQQLGVAHVLEGNVQRAGGKVRVNAQLVDTRTDKHLWGQTYDRDLADVFAIESEIAQNIADQLEAKISPREKAAIAEQPTKDLAAYDLYVRATALIDKATYEEGEEQTKDDFQAVDLLNQAVARDPSFLLAYCRLAEAHDDLYFRGDDRTPNRLALAKAAIDAAFRLKPDSGEVHLALAHHLYKGYFDYDRARDELAIALRTLPNNARIFDLSAPIDRRQGRWHDAVRNHERAMELDPRNVTILITAAVTYRSLRDYRQALAIFDRIIALEPNNILYRLRRARVEVRERADLRPLQAIVGKNFTDNPALLRTDASDCFLVALWARDPVAADSVLAATTDNAFGARGNAVGFTRAYAKGLVARMKGDKDGARAAFSAARTEQEKVVRAQPDDLTQSVELCFLGLIDAALGRKQEALSEGRRAVELLPLTKNALDGADILYFNAVICAQVGERDLAIEQLKTLAKIPAGASYGELRLDPLWDPLRGDPRFEKIVASLAPKDIVNSD